MSKKSIAKLSTIVFALSLFLLINVFAKPVAKMSPPPPPQKTDCTQTTDANLVKTLYEKIKTDSDLSSQLSHINFSVKDKKVTIEGWVAGKNRKKAVEKLVKNTVCVKKVKNNLATYLTTGCGPGQKQCGEICIDKNSECTVGGGNN